MWPCTSKKDDFKRNSQWSWARMAPQVLRSGTTRRHCATWSHANRRSMGYLRVVWSRGWKIRGCRAGLGISDAGPYEVRLGPGLTTGSLVFYPYGAHEPLGSFMWPRYLGDFVRHPNPHRHAASCDLGIWVNSFGVPTDHRLVRHPNPQGHESTRRSHVT